MDIFIAMVVHHRNKLLARINATYFFWHKGNCMTTSPNNYISIHQVKPYRPTIASLTSAPK